MSIMKDLFMEEYDRLYDEAEEAGLPINEDALADKANASAIDRFADMCDAAKDRAKYGADHA